MASMRIGGDYMRLIDADALPRQTQIYEFNGKRMEKEIVSARFIDNAPTIDAIPVETVCEMFGNEAPCNYGLFGMSVDDFMMYECGEWCEDNCDQVPYTECWRKFFEAIEKWRKQNG